MTKSGKPRTTRSTRGAGKSTRSTRGQPAAKAPVRRITKQRLIPVVLLAVLGLVLILYQPVMNHWVGPAQLNQVYAEARGVSAEEIQQNMERHQNEPLTEEEDAALFDPDSVQTIQALAANPVINKEHVIGGIYAPSVGLNMPIMYGLSQGVLLSSAGTMKRDQQMGMGNYSLIGHNSKNPNALFAPTHRLHVGELVYVTNKQQVFVYQVQDNRVVQPSEIDVIDDVAGKKMLTLLSCTDDGTERVLVQAELVDQYDYDEAGEDILNAFNGL